MTTTKRFERPDQPTIVYSDLGDPEAPAVLLLHGGAAGSRANWRDIPGRLAETYRVLAVDMRGHGESEWATSYRIEDYASDIAAFIEQVAARTVTLVGHSLGGLVAAQVAGTRPDLVEGAFFEDPPLHWRAAGGPTKTDARRFDAEVFRARVDELLDRGATAKDLTALALQEWTETDDFFRPRQELFKAQRERGTTIDEIAARVREGFSFGGGALSKLFDETMSRGFVEGLLACDPRVLVPGMDWLAAYDRERPIECPVFVLRADPAVGPPPVGAAFPPGSESRFLATHPDATVEFVPGATHAIHTQMPDLFTEKLQTFLRRVAWVNA